MAEVCMRALQCTICFFLFSVEKMQGEQHLGNYFFLGSLGAFLNMTVTDVVQWNGTLSSGSPESLALLTAEYESRLAVNELVILCGGMGSWTMWKAVSLLVSTDIFLKRSCCWTDQILIVCVCVCVCVLRECACVRINLELQYLF